MKSLRIVATALVFVVAANALAAGYSFMVKPDGSGLGTSVALLKHSSFRDFFIPGLILFCVNGVLNLLTGVMLLSKWRFRFCLLIVQGVLLGGWIFIQVLLLRELNLLHFIFAAISLFFFTAGIYLHHKTTA